MRTPALAAALVLAASTSTISLQFAPPPPARALPKDVVERSAPKPRPPAADPARPDVPAKAPLKRAPVIAEAEKYAASLPEAATAPLPSVARSRPGVTVAPSACLAAKPPGTAPKTDDGTPAAPGTTTPGNTTPGATTPGSEPATGATTPGTTTPGVTAPGSEPATGATAPGATAPGTRAPGATTPGVTAPGSEPAFGATAPGATTPETGVTPGATAPGAEAASGANTPGVTAPKAGAAPRTITPGATVPEAKAVLGAASAKSEEDTVTGENTPVPPGNERTPETKRAPAQYDFSKPNIVAPRLQVPWGLAFLPDGSALVSERGTARILKLRPGSAAEPVGTVPGVSASGEGGLLGIAVSPEYAQDGLVYAYFTSSSDNRIVRFKLGGTITPQVVRSGIPKSSIHNGGRIAFGPDGMLYAGTGDAATTSNAQNPASLAGKILRMTPDGQAPADNPTAGSLVYSLGHRNVQGLAWGQGRMYAAEFGQNRFDEINEIVAGGNYGWPNVEGTGGGPTYRDPIVVWATSEASPSGLAFSCDRLYAAALRGTRLWQVPLNGETPTSALQGAYGRLRTVSVGPDGWLWVTTSNRDGRGSPTPDDDRVVRFPPVAGAPTGG
ncbi:PQQ-dependent sugar dehydrogenase [Spirillospora sp. CA-294931]|uniref:PQQ-dependent sugar dehydrogenase n=1 Tax=Spirillospora sp. CA-294931 TaxID=3240042 RepID=UPI003D8D640B